MKHLAPSLAGRSLAWVADHRTEVEDIINALQGSYVRRARLVIVGCCNSAVIAKDIKGHNLRGLDIGRDVRIGQADFYEASPEELDRLAHALDHSRRARYPYGLLVRLRRYAGLRIGESLGLNKADIITGTDVGKVLCMVRQRMADGSSSTPKARDEDDPPRMVPLGPFLAAKLAEAPTDNQGFYFPRQNRKTVYDRWERASGV